MFCKYQELQKAQSGGLALSISTSSNISVEEAEHKDDEISKLREIVKDYWIKIEVRLYSMIDAQLRFEILGRHEEGCMNTISKCDAEKSSHLAKAWPCNSSTRNVCYLCVKYLGSNGDWM